MVARPSSSTEAFGTEILKSSYYCLNVKTDKVSTGLHDAEESPAGCCKSSMTKTSVEAPTFREKSWSSVPPGAETHDTARVTASVIFPFRTCYSLPTEEVEEGGSEPGACEPEAIMRQRGSGGAEGRF
ncbi:hypothetical protein RRG08_054885 [Elysia crispata]|uniref:Uncharacterized protein n=1 Tax=Elysia crispata TaxID=231223 RepID=A0AAE1DSL7_9GAST|nr:hypothetical protein RRG08_054885 [Elysia crispata]